MKNQYFGDVGDYGKYGLLRFFANNGIKIAVNWYLTEDDGSNDGNIVRYLESDDMRQYDPELFSVLKEMLNAKNRSVLSFEKRCMIPNAVYFNDCLYYERESKADRHQKRSKWHQDALTACSGADLVFLDPDNGARESEPASAKNGVKYCYANEIADYYYNGQNVVYYASKGRRTQKKWEETKLMMKKYLPDADIIVITYHKGTQRSYIFVLHKDKRSLYEFIISNFLSEWSRLFGE